MEKKTAVQEEMKLRNECFSVATIQSIYTFLSEGKKSVVAVAEPEIDSGIVWRPTGGLVKSPPSLEKELRFEFNKIGLRMSEIQESLKCKLHELFVQVIEQNKESVLVSVLREIIPRFDLLSMHLSILELLQTAFPIETFLSLRIQLIAALSDNLVLSFQAEFEKYCSNKEEVDEFEKEDRWTKSKTEYCNTLCFLGLLDSIGFWIDNTLRPALFATTTDPEWLNLQLKTWHAIGGYLQKGNRKPGMTMRSSSVVCADIQRLFVDLNECFPRSDHRFHVSECIELFSKNRTNQEVSDVTLWFTKPNK